MSTTSKMPPVHPGEVLRRELREVGLSANALAKAIDVPVNRVTGILNGDRGITADSALRLARYFDTTSQFWLNLQQAWQLRRAEVEVGSRIRHRVLPRHTESIREAAKAALQAPSLSSPAVSAFKAIETSFVLRDHLNAVERSLTIDWNRQFLRALESPLDELRRAGAFDSTLRLELDRTTRWLTDYHKRFTIPPSEEISRLAAQLSVAGQTASTFQRIAKSLKSPWLDVADQIGAAQRLVDLQRVGRIAARQSSFQTRTAGLLRESLGDWRDTISWPKDIWTDLSARADFYVDRGFDPDLTDMPPSAFREVAGVVRIRTDPPSLVEAYGPPAPAASDPEAEQTLQRTNQAHDWLQRLESHLRRFIDRQMTAAFGVDWPRHRLPNGKYEDWLSKKKAADHAGRPDFPLIAYADFTDYTLVICKRDNWREVFQPHFHRPENIRESLQRLHPIRLDTMHARPITQDDELLLYVETRRLIALIARGNCR